jgi:hypothetical protein
VPQGTGAAADISLRAVCLDAATGAVVWDVEVFAQDGKDGEQHEGVAHARWLRGGVGGGEGRI